MIPCHEDTQEEGEDKDVVSVSDDSPYCSALMHKSIFSVEQVENKQACLASHHHHEEELHEEDDVWRPVEVVISGQQKRPVETKQQDIDE